MYRGDQVHPSDVYAQELFKRKYGWPLWQPEPLERRSETGEPGLVEVRIGDVGWITEGSFRPLFNAIDPEPSKAPDMHVPLPIPPDGLVRKANFLQPHVIVSRSMTLVGAGGKIEAHSVGASFDIECMEDQAAFLVLRDEASREYLSNLDRRISNYFLKNYKSWLQYERDLGLDADESQLIFIAGWVKTSEWALGSIAQKGRAAKLHFDADFSTATAQLTVKAESKSWPAVDQRVGPPLAHRILGKGKAVQDPEQNGTASRPQRNKGKKGKGKQRWDPDAPTLADVVENAEASAQHEPSGLPRNQCVFINYFKLRKRYVILTDAIKAAAGPHDLQRHEDDESVEAVQTRFDTPASDDDVWVEQVPSVKPTYDPVGFVLDYILQNSEAQLAIACDWQLIQICGETVPDDIPAFLQQAQPPIEVTEEGVGMLLLDDYKHLVAASAMPGQVAAESTGDSRETGEQAGPTMEGDRGGAESDDDEGGPGRRTGGGDVPDDSAKEAPKGRQHTDWAVAHTIGITSLVYAPDGTRVVAGSEDGTLCVRDTRTTYDAPVRVEAHPDSVCTLAFAPDGSKLVTSSRSGALNIWKITPHVLATGTEPGWTPTALESDDGFVDAIAWSPDSKTLATGSTTFHVKLWDADTGALRHTLRGHSGIVLLIRFSPDGRLVASAGADMSARIWDVATGEARAELRGHEGIIYSLAWAPDAKRILTGADEGSARIWMVASGEELVTLREHAGAVWEAAFSADGRRVLTASGDGQIKVCDSYSAEVVRSIETGEGVCCAGFSDDGARAFAVAGDHVLKVWEVDSGRQIAAKDGHEDSVNIVRFAPDGTQLVSASDDGTLRFWPLTLPEDVEMA